MSIVQTATPPAPPKSGPKRRTHFFFCESCEAVEIRQTPALPRGWTIDQVNGEDCAFCGDCSRIEEVLAQ